MMKRFIPLVLVAAYTLFGGILLFQLMSQPKPWIITQNSEYAIIDLRDEEFANAFVNGEIQIKSPHPNSKTLIRVHSENPSRIYGKLKSDGEILLINPKGIIIGPKGIIDVGNRPRNFSTLELNHGDTVRLGNTAEQFGTDMAEVKAHGNVYALAIKKEGKIQATNNGHSIKTGGRLIFSNPKKEKK